MPNVSEINQPFGDPPDRAGDRLVALLTRDTNQFDTVRMTVAFAKSSGVSRIFDQLQAFVADGGNLQVVVGVDYQGTSRQGLELLLATGANVYVFHNPGFQTFHPKLYLFQRSDDEGVAIVGSNNLTSGGLYSNFEFSVYLEYDLSEQSNEIAFSRLLESFENFTDLNLGTVLELDQTLVTELDQRGYLLDEANPPPTTGGGSGSSGAPPLFKYFPVPQAPKPSQGGTVVVSPVSPGQATETFTMTLGPRDTRQLQGYSQDIFIPLAARDARPLMWDWPTGFSPSGPGASSIYLERRVDVMVTAANDVPKLVENVRLYFYPNRSEFRMNCSALVEGSSVGDILVISSVGSGVGYDYEAIVIPNSHPMYSTYLGVCSTVVQQSGKRWGYS